MSIQINNCICFEYGSNTYCCVLRQMQYATSIGSLLVDSAPGAGDLTLHTHTSHTHAHTLQHYICYFVYFKFLIQNRVAISLPGRSTLFTLLLCFFFLYFSLHFLFCCCALFTIIVSQWSYLYIDEAHSDFWINIWLYSGKAQQKKMCMNWMARQAEIMLIGRAVGGNNIISLALLLKMCMVYFYIGIWTIPRY